MRAILRVVVGYREDVDLAGRRWHRWAVRAFRAAAPVVASYFVAAAIYGIEPEFSNVRVVARLSERTNTTISEYQRQVAVRQFVEGDARLAIVDDRAGTFERLTELKPENVGCFTVDPPTRRPECILMLASRVIEAHDIVQFEISPRATVARALGAVVIAVVWLAIAASLYFRGVVHIICGPRR
jgi:hypothetical protein